MVFAATVEGRTLCNHHHHVLIGYNKDVLAVGSIGPGRAFPRAGPHLIAVRGLPFRGLFLHHFVHPLGRNKSAALPHTAVEQQQTELSHRLALKIKPPSTRIIAFGAYLPLHLPNAKGRENTLSEEAEKRLAADLLHDGREEIGAERVVLKEAPGRARRFREIVAHPAGRHRTHVPVGFDACRHG